MFVYRRLRKHSISLKPGIKGQSTPFVVKEKDKKGKEVDQLAPDC